MKMIFGLIVVGAVSLVGYLAMQIASPSGESQPSATGGAVNNVSMNGAQQIVEIKAKGGYTPEVSVAKAGVPTTLRINTSGTFDCSSQVRIPSMNISKALPPSGVTEIALGELKEGVLQGTCGMGMYPFQINVQS
jgi:plastocyanin domain-containing protein